MAKLNCWEFHRCGRQPGGEKVGELGVCPAAIEAKLDGLHGGKNGGRACWVVAGTLCGGRERGIFAAKYRDCLKCPFYRQVMEEEGKAFVPSKDLLKRLREN
jgi:hypothetical protein